MEHKTTANINLNVTEWKKSSLESGVVIYVIQIQKKGSSEWFVEYRYSQFDDLHKSLKKLYSNLPSLPGKSFFKISEDSQLEERRLGLQEYMRILISRPDVFNSEALKQFLQLDKHAAETIVNPPKLLGETSGFVHGVRDFYYEKEKGAIFILSGDMNVASRMDAYLTNMKMPWEKEAPPTLLSVGALECWVQKNDGENYQFERVWSKTYPLQAICLYWNQEDYSLFIGLDEGKLNILKIAQDVNFMRYEEQFEESIHEGRIMGIYHFNLHNTTYTISEDKTLKTIQNGTVINSVKNSHSGLTALHGDSEYKRLFATNRSGNIFIYDISSGNPVIMNTLQTSEKGAIRGLTVDTFKNYLFTGGFDDGEIGVFDLQKPGREKFVKQTASFKGKTHVRYIEWSSSRGEVYVGCKDGSITVWNAKKAQPIYVLKAHSNDITKLQWLEDRKTLVTTSKEKVLKFWSFPKEWRDKKLEQQEDREWDQNVRQQNIDKVKEYQKKALEDSDEDDLLGWHKF